MEKFFCGESIHLVFIFLLWKNSLWRKNCGEILCGENLCGEFILRPHILQVYSLANPPPMTFIANNGKDLVYTYIYQKKNI